MNRPRYEGCTGLLTQGLIQGLENFNLEKLQGTSLLLTMEKTLYSDWNVGKTLQLKRFN